ncbi:MAG: glycosyltransferase family 39 protein [Myxococcota bacterium]|nr:glycosyltransferase family 39 protein [Myxococcota bacterium]
MNAKVGAIVWGVLSMGILVGFEYASQYREDVFVKSTYFFMFGLLSFFCVLLGRSRTLSLRWQSLQPHRWPLAAIAILLVIVYVSVPFEIRVLADESNLISVSRSMLDTKETVNSISGKFYYESYHSTHDTPPIRPPLFPFGVHLVHALFGYAPENAGWFNLFLLAVLFSVVYYWGNRFGDRWSGLGTVFLVASIPIVSLCARSGGFDLLSAVLLLLCLGQLYRYEEKVDSHSLWLLWGVVILFSHARYENVLLMPLIAVYILHDPSLREPMIQRASMLSVATFFFLLPKWFQMRLSQGKYENDSTSLLSPAHWWENVQSFVAAQFDMSFVLPYNPIAIWGAAIGLLWMLHSFWRIRLPGRVFFYLFPSFLFTMIFLAHFLGDYQNNTTMRFYFVLHNTESLVLGFVISRVWNGRLVLICGLLSFLLYHPIAVRNEYLKALLYPREMHRLYDFLEPYRSQNVLFLTDMPGAIVIFDVGALSIEYANLNVDEIQQEWRERLFEEIFVVQRVSFTDGKPIADDTLNARFRLETLISHQTSDEYFLRISRVLEMNDESLPP